MKEFKEFAKRIIIENIILLSIVTFFLYHWNMRDCIIGWLWGSIGNFSYFGYLYYNLQKLATLEGDEREVFIQKSMARRYGMMAVFLTIAVIVPHIHVLAAAMGFITFKFLVYIDHFVAVPLLEGRGNKNN